MTLLIPNRRLAAVLSLSLLSAIPAAHARTSEEIAARAATTPSRMLAEGVQAARPMSCQEMASEIVAENAGPEAASPEVAPRAAALAKATGDCPPAGSGLLQLQSSVSALAAPVGTLGDRRPFRIDVLAETASSARAVPAGWRAKARTTPEGVDLSLAGAKAPSLTYRFAARRANGRELCELRALRVEAPAPRAAAVTLDADSCADAVLGNGSELVRRLCTENHYRWSSVRGALQARAR